MKLFLMVLLMSGFVFAKGKQVSSETVATAYSTGSSSVDVSSSDTFGVLLAITNSAPVSGTFTCAANDICTKSSHGYLTGLKVTLTTSAADLPLNLLTGTDYFVIKIDADTFYLASSLALAQAGTAIDIGDAGTGTHTITPTALAGGSVKLQVSNDDSNWADLPIESTGDAQKSSNVTGTGNVYLSGNVRARYVRVYYTLTAGQLSVAQKVSLQ